MPVTFIESSNICDKSLTGPQWICAFHLSPFTKTCRYTTLKAANTRFDVFILHRVRFTPTKCFFTRPSMQFYPCTEGSGLVCYDYIQGVESRSLYFCHLMWHFFKINA